MTSSLSGKVTLAALLEQAWQQVEEQARGMLKRAVQGLLEAERDRRVAEARERGEKVYRWGYTVRKCWTTLWGRLDQVLFALTVGGLSQRKVVDWVRRFLGGRLSLHDRCRAGARPPAGRAAAERSDSAAALSGPGGGWDLSALPTRRGGRAAKRRAAGGRGRAGRRCLRGVGLAGGPGRNHRRL